MSSTEATTEVFLTAFRSLSESEKEAIISRLLHEEKAQEQKRPSRKDAIHELMEHPLVFAGSRPPSRDEMHDGR